MALGIAGQDFGLTCGNKCGLVTHNGWSAPSHLSQESAWPRSAVRVNRWSCSICSLMRE